MESKTWELIEEARKRLGYTKNHIDWVSCNYKLENNMISIKPSMISINGCDLYCDAEHIYTGPFRVIFDKELPTIAKEINFDEDSNDLNIDDITYHIKDYVDIGFFIEDFDCADKQALINLMKHFSEWLIKTGEK